MGRAVGIPYALFEACVGVDLRRADRRVRVAQPLFKVGHGGVHIGGFAMDFGRAAPDRHTAVDAGALFEIDDVLGATASASSILLV